MPLGPDVGDRARTVIASFSTDSVRDVGEQRHAVISAKDGILYLPPNVR